MPHLPSAALELLTSQHGVATTRQLVEAGVSEKRIRTASRTGGLARLHRGAYAEGSIWGSAAAEAQHSMRLAAVQLAAPDAVAWGPTATIAWGLPVRRVPERPIVWRAPALGATAGAVVKRSQVPPVEAQLHLGLWVPSKAAAVVEVASSSDLADSLITVDAGLRSGLRPDHLRRLAMARPLHLGRSRAMCALQWGDPGSESWLESLSRGRMIERRMPVPLCNVVLRRGRRTARVDDLWPELGVVGECDGKGKYAKGFQGETPSEVIWREKRRHEWIEEIGFEVARWGTAEVADDGAAMGARFRRADALQRGARFTWPTGVTAELPLLDGVTPPPRVIAKVMSLQALGYPFTFVDRYGYPVEVRTLAV